jgi:hypothetical protein
MRTLRAAGRSLMISAEQCRDGQPSDRARLIVWHIVRCGEGLYCLTDANGELKMAIEGIAANTANYLPTSVNDLYLEKARTGLLRGIERTLDLSYGLTHGPHSPI